MTGAGCGVGRGAVRVACCSTPWVHGGAVVGRKFGAICATKPVDHISTPPAGLSYVMVVVVGQLVEPNEQPWKWTGGNGVHWNADVVRNRAVLCHLCSTGVLGCYKSPKPDVRLDHSMTTEVKGEVPSVLHTARHALTPRDNVMGVLPEPIEAVRKNLRA